MEGKKQNVESSALRTCLLKPKYIASVTPPHLYLNYAHLVTQALSFPHWAGPCFLGAGQPIALPYTSLPSVLLYCITDMCSFPVHYWALLYTTPSFLGLLLRSVWGNKNEASNYGLLIVHLETFIVAFRSIVELSHLRYLTHFCWRKVGK